MKSHAHASRAAFAGRTIALVVFSASFHGAPVARAEQQAGGPPVSATVPQTIAFQGFLTDNASAPVNGTVSLVFNLYDVPTGGTRLWTETQPSVSVASGVFQVALGAVTPFPTGLFDTSPRHLGIRVNGEAEMPRTELRATPFAYRADAASTVDGRIRLRAPVSGFASVESIDQPNSAMSMNFWNTARTYPLLTIGGSSFNPTGIIEMSNDHDNLSMRILGSANSLGDPRLELWGSLNSIILQPSALLDGNEQVILVPGAVDHVELWDDPGLASNNNTATVTLTGPRQSVITRTIIPPADGYVMAFGQCATRITHTNGTGTSCVVGLSDDGTSYGAAQDVNVQISSQAPSGAYAIPVGLNAVFTATAANAMTVHILAEEVSGNVNLEDLSLTLLFVPTAYGTVSPALVAPGGIEPDSGRGSRGSQTPAEIAVERAESVRWNAERMEREVTEMRAEVTKLREEVAAERADRQ